MFSPAITPLYPSTCAAPSVLNGHLSLHAQPNSDGKTVLARQAFRAPFHLSKPYWDGRTLIVQVVNPTAGILAGDSLSSEVIVGPQAALLLTTPSATRVFKMDTGSAESQQRFTIERDGWLDVLPEPIIPHSGSCFRQTTKIVAADQAEFFYADLLLPGRIARGETWAWTRLWLDLQIEIAGELVLRERFDQSGAELRRLAQLAGNGASAGFCNLVLSSPKLENEAAWRPQISALHGQEASWLGVSRLRGMAPSYSVKLIAPDGDVVRRLLRQIRQILNMILPHLASDPRKL